jgi:hypothetical protein
MKRKWLFLPDILLFLLVCLTCERRELSHQPFDSNEPIMLAKENKNKRFNRSWEKEEIVWETLKDNITTQLSGLKVKILEE